MRIAELFYLLNDTNWNKFDDKFFLINRRWFDRWKDYISYDYIVKQLVEFGKQESDLSINRLGSKGIVSSAKDRSSYWFKGTIQILKLSSKSIL